MSSTVSSIGTDAALSPRSAAIKATLKEPRGKPTQVALPAIAAATEQPGWQGAAEPASSANTGVFFARPTQKLPSSCVWDDRLFTLDKDVQGTVFSFLDDRTLAAVPGTCRTARLCFSRHLGEEHFMRERMVRSFPDHPIRKGDSSVAEQYMALSRTPYNRNAGICLGRTLIRSRVHDYNDKWIESDSTSVFIYAKPIRIFDMTTGCIKVLEAVGADSITTMIQGPKGQWITGDKKGWIQFINVENGICERTLRANSNGSIYSLLLVGENTLIVAGHRTQIWNLATGACERTLPPATKKQLQMTNQGQLIISQHPWSLLLMNPATGLVHHALEHDDEIISTLVIGDFVISSTQDHRLSVWDSTTGTKLRTLEGRGPISCLKQFSPTQVLAIDNNGLGIVWDIATGEQLHSFQEDLDNLRSIIVTPQKTLIYGSHTIFERNLVTNTRSVLYARNLMYVHRITLLPSGQLLIINDKEARILDFSCSTLRQLESIINAFEKGNLDEAAGLFRRLPQGMQQLIGQQNNSRIDINAVRNYVAHAYPSPPEDSSSEESSNSSAPKATSRASDDDEKQESPSVLLGVLQTAVIAGDETTQKNTVDRLGALDPKIRGLLMQNLHDIQKERGFLQQGGPAGRTVFVGNADALKQTRLEAIQHTLELLKK